MELKKEIKDYCDKNNLNFEKAEKMCKCWNENFIALQHDDKKNNGHGLLDETPMPVVLLIERDENGVKFTQTEYTYKYLGIDN